MAVTDQEFDDALVTERQSKTSSPKTYDGCPCGSISFVGGHITDPRDGRVYNRCVFCNSLVRSHYVEKTVETLKICIRQEL